MTWTKTPDDWFDRPAVIELSRSARLLDLEGRVWCNKVLTDGAIPRAALRRLTDSDDVDQDLAELVQIGLWERTDDGYQIADWTEHQESREVVEQRRGEMRERQDRSRRHRAGDHSTCRPSYCKNAPVTRDTSRDERGSHTVSHGSPTRPVPTRPLGRGGREGTPAASLRSLEVAPVRSRVQVEHQPADVGSGWLKIRLAAPLVHMPTQAFATAIEQELAG